MKKAILLVLIAIFGFSTLLPVSASAATTTRNDRIGSRGQLLSVSAHPRKHKKHKKHKKHHKRRTYRAGRRKNKSRKV